MTPIHSKMKFNIYLTLILLLSFTSQITEAGNYPFPRNTDYPYGQKPNNAVARHALLAYQNWKTKYYDEMLDNTARVFFNNAKEVVSEGIAYGMLLSVYADDQNVFDKLWRYYQKHSNHRGVMHWKIDKDDKVIGSNGATDSEEDAAMALVVAHYQWGSAGDTDYHGDALTLIDAIMQYEVEAGTFRLKSGDGWGPSQTTNPSYFAPAYYKIFHQITGNTDWLKVVDKCYEILEKNADPVTGLVSDWCDQNGNPVDNMDYRYTFDASRFPWRIATDYLWFGDERAALYCNKMSAFVKNKLGGSKKINGFGYTKAGTSLGGGHNPVFVSTFALTGMASDPSYQTHLNDSYTDVVQTDATEYFGATLRALSLMMLSGNFYKMPEPICESPNLGPDISLCDFPDLVLQSGFSDETGKKFIWSDGSTGNSLAITKPGTYWVRSDSSSCIRRDSVVIKSFEVSIGPDREIPMEGDSLFAMPTANDIQYQWSTGENTQSIFIKKEGTYWVIADSSGCIDTASIVLTRTYPPEKTLYPNPAKDARFKIYIRDSTITSIQVQTYQPNGMKRIGYHFDIQPEQEVHNIHLQGLAEGLYIAKIKYTTSVGQTQETIQRIFIR
jgi:endo-1,4-beta-D-glucanase Y